MPDVFEKPSESASADADRIGLSLAVIAGKLGDLCGTAEAISEELGETAEQAGQANIGHPKYIRTLCKNGEFRLGDVAHDVATTRDKIAERAAFLLGIDQSELGNYVEGMERSTELQRRWVAAGMPPREPRVDMSGAN